MTVLLIGATCVFMNVLIGYSGRHYMDSIGSVSYTHLSLVTRPCATPQNKVRDVLVYRRNHLFHDHEKELIRVFKGQNG